MSNSYGKKRKAQDLDFPPQKVTRATDSQCLNIKVAKDVNIGHFAEGRAIEIQALSEVVKDVGGNHMAFQKLPCHMRRRAMSHNIKRVPRRLHEQVKSELEKVKPPLKRPSRRYRRKPSNLLSDYERRKRRISWLETHIWHAKRFKMVEKWGYRLPLHPNEKSIRACYRAVRQHCLLQDVSYECYIELKGKRENIIEGLRHLTNEETGPTFAARATLRGTRQGSLTLYHYDSYPHHAVGQITYLWCPQVEANGDNSVDSILWLCCQPAFYTEALNEVKKCFPLQGGQSKDCEMHLKGDRSRGLVVTSLKDQLVKFRLFGPMSTLVLRETLKFWDLEDCFRPQKENTEELVQDEVLWWKEFYKQPLNQTVCQLQREAWEVLTNCQSPSEVPSHCVVSAVVRDPRLLLPPKRNKVFPDEKDSMMKQFPKEIFNSAEVSDSPLWRESIRHSVKDTKISESDLNSMRSKHLIPGTPLELGERESRIPVILIQRPGYSHFHHPSSSVSSVQEGYSCGWDLIIPSGWAMAFWVALVYRGARVGGLRESHSISLQACQLNQVKDCLDSSAGKKEMISEGRAMQQKHDNRPPAKRPNHIKLGFKSPFSLNFIKLCMEWATSIPVLLKKFGRCSDVCDSLCDDIYVMRHRRLLQLLNFALTDMRKFMSGKSYDGKSHKKLKDSGSNPLIKFLSEERGNTLIKDYGSALVPVCLRIQSRGVPVSHAHICQPLKNDLKRFSNDKHYGGPVEQLHSDPDALRRKKERRERLRLRKKKKQGRKIQRQEFASMNTNSNRNDNRSNKNNSTKVAELKTVAEQITSNVEDTNEESQSILNQASRPIIGFVTKGDYDLGQGQGSGMGFCSVAALLHIIAEQRKEKNCLVLVRNPSSFQYRFATVAIVI